MDKLTIKQIRVGLDMTQKEMGDYLNISEVAYRNKENVNVNIKFTNSTNIKVTSLTNVYTPSSDESLSSLVRSFVR